MSGKSPSPESTRDRIFSEAIVKFSESDPRFFLPSDRAGFGENPRGISEKISRFPRYETERNGENDPRPVTAP
jgi:hypothetical protein